MASSDRKFLICLILYKPRKPLLHTCPMCTFMAMYLSNYQPRLRTELTGLVAVESTLILLMFTLASCWWDLMIRNSVLMSFSMS